MKGLASGLLFLSSLIGFTSPWAVRRAKIDVEQSEKIEQSIEIVKEITIDDEPYPIEMIVTQEQELHGLV